MQPAPLPVWHDQCKNWAQYFNIGKITIRPVISDRDQQIRMMFLTPQFNDAVSASTR